MENVLLITDALEFIEANLTQDIKTDDIAKSLYCSKSYLEKLFRFVTNMSIKDYSLRRRMSCAAKEIIQCQDMSLLDLAIKYGYSSNEAFSRAFAKVWQVTPSEYRKNPVHFELFPALRLEKEIPLTLYVTSYKIEGKTLKYSELFTTMQRKLDCIK